MKQLLTIFLALSLLCGCTTDGDRSRMRSGLDSINQRNRNDQHFTVADVQLSRVYAQMAEVFYYQGLYRHQLASDANAVKYAWLGKDTIAALMSYEQKAFAYEALGLLDSAIITAEDMGTDTVFDSACNK